MRFAERDEVVRCEVHDDVRRNRLEDRDEPIAISDVGFVNGRCRTSTETFEPRATAADEIVDDVDLGSELEKARDHGHADEACAARHDDAAPDPEARCSFAHTPGNATVVDREALCRSRAVSPRSLATTDMPGQTGLMTATGGAARHTQQPEVPPSHASGGERPLRVAFGDIVNPAWTAGSLYYTNLFSALHRLDDRDRPRVIVIVPEWQREGGYETYRHLSDEVVPLPGPPRAGTLVRQVERARRRFLGGSDSRARQVERVLREHRIDAMFGCWTEFGPRFRVPLLGWITDFNHIRRPGTRPAADARHRDELFMRMAANCSRVVVSSEDARRDFVQFAPSYAHKARVLRFVANVPEELYDRDPRGMCEEYDLPERFFYLPNQFWPHKNHALVVEALALLKEHPEITVVCTGNPANNNRDPLLFAELLARVSRLGLRDRFIVLGWVPHSHILQLMRQSVAVLQPSLFEGWSTTVEETKSIGKSIVISDIPVHREQAPPSALFFDPADADELAQRLVEMNETRAPGPDEALEAQAREAFPARALAYAETFLDLVRETVATPAI